MIRKILFFIFFNYVLFVNTFSQILKPIEWSYVVDTKQLNVGDSISLTFIAEIEDSWYLYSFGNNDINSALSDEPKEDGSDSDVIIFQQESKQVIDKMLGPPQDKELIKKVLDRQNFRLKLKKTCINPEQSMPCLLYTSDAADE